MLPLVVPTAASGIHFVAAAVCMCPSVAGNVVANEVVVPPDMHFSPAVGAATAVVVVVVVIAILDLFQPKTSTFSTRVRI